MSTLGRASISPLTLSTGRKMSAFNRCDCGWESKSRNPSASTRAVASHLKKCPLYAEKAKGTGNLPKRGISDIDMGNTGGPSAEPPHKIPWVFTVSGIHRAWLGGLIRRCRRGHRLTVQTRGQMNQIHHLHLPSWHSRQGVQGVCGSFPSAGETSRQHHTIRLHQSHRSMRRCLSNE